MKWHLSKPVFFHSWALKPMNTHLVVLNFEHLKPVKATPWLIKGAALDCVSKLSWIFSEEMLRTCSCSQNRPCPPAIKQGCFYTSLLQLVTVLCPPSTWMLRIHPELYFPLCLGCDFSLLFTPGTHQVSLPGQSWEMQSTSDKGDLKDPNFLDGGVIFLKPPTS